MSLLGIILQKRENPRRVRQMKKQQAGLLPIFLLLTIFVPQPAQGETRYVSDILVVTVRSSAGENFDTLETLKTNEPVEVLGEQGMYTHVKTPSGTDGWILSQYLVKETPKPVIISRLEKEKRVLESRVKDLEAVESNLKEEVKSLKERYKSTVGDIEEKYTKATTDASQTSKELETVREKLNRLTEQSSDVVALAQERDGLRTANDGLTSEVEYLRRENERLGRTGMIRWFLAGGGVLLVGWMVGRVSRKKKKYY